MARITEKDLDRIVAALNSLTRSPGTPWTRTGTKIIGNVGNYHVTSAYGRYALERVADENGATRNVFECGYIPARELHSMIRVFIVGIMEGIKI